MQFFHIVSKEGRSCSGIEDEWKSGLTSLLIISIGTQSNFNMLAKEWNLVFLVALLLMFLAIWFITGISPKQRNRKVRMLIKHTRKQQKSFVRIESIGKLPVEILAPEVKFYNRSSSRSFAIKSPGRNIFPLSLFPLTDYEFKVDLTRFYDHDNSLQQYRKAKLIVREKTGRLLKSKRIWI